jgi:hypothetical protein
MISHLAIFCPSYKSIQLVRQTKQHDISAYSSDKSPCKAAALEASPAASLPDRHWYKAKYNRLPCLTDI